MTEYQHPAEQGSNGGDFIPKNPPYPMYQYSVFLNDGSDEQLVVRAETFELLLAGKQNLSKMLQQVNNNHSAPENQNQEACDHPDYKTLVVKKDSPNKGRQCRACTKCGVFLGFI